MLIQYKKLPQVLAVALLAMGMTLSAAHADNDEDENRGSKDDKHSSEYRGKDSGEERGKPVQPTQVNAKFQKECSSCHIAYAPELLPAKSWLKVMDGLDNHFDLYVSLAAKDNKEITDFLVNNASNRWNATTAPLRITGAGWFKRDHLKREVPPEIWTSTLVKSPSNCEVCHTQAARGDFSKSNIKIPK